MSIHFGKNSTITSTKAEVTYGDFFASTSLEDCKQEFGKKKLPVIYLTERYTEEYDRYIHCHPRDLADFLSITPLENASEYTYKMTGSRGVPNFLYHSELRKRGYLYTPYSEDVSYHLYAFETGTSDWKTKSIVKNALDGLQSLTSKTSLEKLLGEYMTKHYTLKQVLGRNGTSVIPGVIIIKEASGKSAFGGKGIQVISRGERPVLKPRTDYSISEYLEDIKLFQGKKFHLRVYLFLTTWGDYSIFPRYRILTSLKEYKKGDYRNREIHDSHVDSTGGDYFFDEEDEVYSEKTDSMIKEICLKIAEAATPKPYTESKQAYEALGIDFLVREDGTPVLLEVNTGAGVTLFDKKSNFYDEFIDAELNLVGEVLH